MHEKRLKIWAPSSFMILFFEIVFLFSVLKFHSNLFMNSGIVNQIENLHGLSRMLQNLSYGQTCWLDTTEKKTTNLKFKAGIKKSGLRNVQCGLDLCQILSFWTKESACLQKLIRTIG